MVPRQYSLTVSPVLPSLIWRTFLPIPLVYPHLYQPSSKVVANQKFSPRRRVYLFCCPAPVGTRLVYSSPDFTKVKPIDRGT
jgi:hypothetical protein